MKKGKIGGFNYYLDKERIRSYQGKSPELKLKWLYMGSLLRMSYPKDIIRLQDKFREGR